MYAAWNRRDIVKNKTWMIPFTTLPGRPSQTFLVTRTPEGQESIITHHGALEVLSEAQTWKETVTTSRFPAAVLARPEKGRHTVKCVPTISISEYREIRPKGSCLFWRGEKLTGVKLSSATEREGLVDKSPLHELTPPGWKRDIGFEGAICGLIRDDSTG